ncbi:MAG: beta strand repeat-containing protein [Terracidiphilus sp.]
MNSTFYANSGGAIAVIDSGAVLTANNNLFVGNTSGAIINGGGTANASYNVYYGNGSSDCTSCTSNSNPTVASSDPLALPLGSYGGATQTYLPQPGSAAICAGSAADVPEGVIADQRGFALVTSCVDAGAVQTNYIQVQSSGGSGGSCPGSTCRLTAALAAANTAGYGDIDFASSVTSITVAGTLELSGTAGINIIGPGANKLTVNGGGSSSDFSVFTVDANMPAVLYGLTIAKGNTATGSGGGINNSGDLTLAGGAVDSNASGGDGGGIFISDTGTMTIVDSTISNNTAVSGGGIYNTGTLQLTESTVSTNTASNGGSAANGAGIDNFGTLAAINSTIANNQATGTGNPANAGGGINVASGTASLANTIVSGNTVGSGGANSNIAGTYTGSTNAGNVVGGNADATTSLLNGTGATITLSSLGYSPTTAAALQTQVPVPGNPAICAGKSASVPSSITTDERGQPISPNDCSSGSVDAGAVQTNYSMSFTTNPPSSVTVDQGFGAAVTLDESGQPFSASSVNIPLTLSSGTLNGTASAATSSGVATYSGLSAAFGSSLKLNSSLLLNGALSLTAASSSFDVTMASSTASLQSSSSSTSVGQPVTLTATVSPSATNPVGAADTIAMTGSVTYQAGGQTVTCSTDSFNFDQTSGNATDTCVTSDLPAGSPVSIKATYSGDSNYQASQPSTAVHVTVSAGSATTSLTCTSTDPNSLDCSNSVALNATLTFTESVSAPSGGITPGGTVTFYANGSKISACGTSGTVTLSSGSAVCSTSKLKADTYSIVAKYSGDSNYSATTDTLNNLVIGQAGTSVTMISSSPTATVNQSVMLTATVGPANANPALSGTLTFVDTSNSNATICAGAVDPTSQQFSCSTQALSLGTHKIQAKYSADNNYSGSNSSLLTQQVNAGTATIPSFSSSSNPSVVNNTVSFTATISVPSGPTSPAGYVHFTANGNTITGCDKITLTLSSPGATSGTAPCTTSSLAASTTPYTIVATFTDTNGNFTSASATLNPAQTVSAAATTVLITAAPSTTTVNVPVTYTVTATAASTAYPLTGTVQVSDNGNVICSGLALTQAAGSPTGTNQGCTESNLTAGVHTITATYNLIGSDPNNGTGSGSTTVPVAPAITSVMVISSQNPSIVTNPNNDSDSVTFTATVTSTGTISVPLQGSVTFTENGLVLQGAGCPSPAPVNAGGQANCTTTSLPAGADTILAVYSNDTNYTGSSGYLSANNQVVPQTVQDFSLVISSTPPVVVSQGYTSSSDLFTPQTISVVPISIQGFATATTPTAAPLNLACSVTAVFSPASTPTLPLCTPATATLAVSGTGAQGAVPIVVDATKASAGIYAVTETGTDPTTELAHSASFQVTVESASDPVTVVSGATTGNGGNLSFILPAGVTLSNILCKSVSGPNLTGSVSPDSLGITCSFNPTSITNSSTSMEAVSIAATVGTSGATGGALASNARHTNLWVAGLLGLPFFGLVGLIGGRKSSRSVFFRLMVIAVVCMVAFQALGCGGSFKTLPGNSSGGGGKTPPGVYKILVVGTGSDGQTYEAVLQLNVQL